MFRDKIRNMWKPAKIIKVNNTPTSVTFRDLENDRIKGET